MNDQLFRILAAVIFVTGAVISSYHRRKADLAGGAVSLKEEGLAMIVALRVTGLALWLAIFAYLIQPAWVSWAKVDMPEWARWLGVAMGVGADALAYWVFRSLGNNISPTVVTRKTHTLVTSGPYRWVRHPLYAMGMIAYLGFALLAENALIAAIAVVGFLLLNVRLPREEARLIERFGDEYRDYMRRTGRFLPRVFQ